MDDLLSAVLPALLDIAGLFLAALLSWLALKAKQKFAIDIEAAHRDALHTALMTGIRNALQKGIGGEGAVKLAVTYATQSVPDAIHNLAPAEPILQAIARAKLEGETKAAR